MMSKKRNKSFIASVVSLFLLSSLALAGCSGCFGVKLQSMSFKDSQIVLNVGDVFDVKSSSLNFEPALAADKNFTVVSDNENVVIADGRTLTAVGAGETTITAVSESDSAVRAECKVVVNYAPPSGVSLSVKGDIVQYIGDVREVTLTAVPEGNVDPDLEYEWSVNGTAAAETGAQFSFTPEDKAGESKISVKLDGVIASASVRVFSAAIGEVQAEVSGQLEQIDSYSAVKVTLAFDKTTGDPEPFIEWYVDGKLYLSDTKTLSFTPQNAGTFDIGVKVNGKTVLINGENKLTIVAKGSVIPTNLSVDFNNVYPNVIIRWNHPHTDNMKYQLKIENLTTGAADETLTGTNASAAKYFDGESFNAGEVLDLTAASYRISVRSLGDNDTFSASAYSESVTTEKLSDTAVKYLSDKAMDGLMDHYIVSDDEFNELYSYYLAYRKSAAKVAYTVYMGYTSTKGKNQLMEDAFTYGATTGSYFNSGDGSTVKGGTFNVSVTCKNSVIPTLTGGDVYTQLNALEPHVAKSSTRTKDHVFAIESRAVSASVKTSEELFRAVELGAKPVPEANSTAQTLYNFAKGLLREIISDDMTDVEKVHAVYDWIMWNVQYDYKSTKETDAGRSGMYKAYYLDGVLTNKDSYAVCDGMAKTLSLLCNMEGIPAYRVTGIAGGSVAGMTASAAKAYKEANWGGHAWNKVFVEGQWYVVDPTWGDQAGVISNKPFELALHEWLLVSDEFALDTHEYDNTTNNPTTAQESYNVYDNVEYSFIDASGETVFIDTYVDALGSALTAEAADMMAYLDAQRKEAARSVAIYNKTIARQYVALEITAADSIVDSFMDAATSSLKSQNPFRAALAQLGYSSTQYRIISFTDRVLVMLSL